MRRPRLLTCLALVALVLAGYGRALAHGFVHYDVDLYLLDNEMVRRGLTLEGLRWAFTTGYAANWHPLTWLSHMLDVELFGLAPAGHHATSLALHALSACLLFTFLERATGALRPAALAAALFAVHPLRVESVVWAAERKDVLAGALWMGALVAHGARARRGGAWRGALVLLLVALGLLAKPVVVTLPCVLLLVDVWPLGRLRGRDAAGTPVPVAGAGRLALEKLPLLLLAAASCVVTYRVQAAGAAVRDALDLPLAARAANAAVACGFYLVKALWPTGLAAFYPHPDLARVAAGTTQGGAALAWGALLAAVTVAVLLQRRRPWLGVSWLWFLGTLVPVIGLVQVGHQAYADRYAYLPLVGLHLLLAYGLAEPLRGARPGVRRAAAWAAGLYLAALLLLTVRQTGVWRSPRALWAHALAVTEENGQAHYFLGSALAREGDLAAAVPELEAAIELEPAHWGAWFGLADALEKLERADEAEAAYAEALRIRPRDGELRYRHGVFLARRGRFAEAFDEYERAVQAGYDGGEVRRNRGLALSKLAVGPDGAVDAERLEAAAAELERAVRLEPERAETRYFLAEVLLGLGRVDEARAALEAAAAAGHAAARARLDSL